MTYTTVTDITETGPLIFWENFAIPISGFEVLTVVTVENLMGCDAVHFV
jgi:hypothetical protein